MMPSMAGASSASTKSRNAWNGATTASASTKIAFTSSSVAIVSPR